jgi:hypothetical protein
VLEYTHETGDCSITGGYRYRGTQIPGLGGTYLYSDYCTGRIWGATQASDGTWTTTLLIDTPYFITTFGEDQGGELYVTHHAAAGAVYRIVKGPASPTLTVNASTVPLTVPPGATVQVRAQNGPGQPENWVGLYAHGAADTDYSAWLYLNGTQALPSVGFSVATLSFAMPTTAGIYEFRFFKNNAYERLAISPAVTAGPGATLTVNSSNLPLTVAAGTTVQVGVQNGPGLFGDWVGLYAQGAADADYITWLYVNGTQTYTEVGLTSGTLVFAMPTTPGAYEFRFLRDVHPRDYGHIHERLATSPPVTVTP